MKYSYNNEKEVIEAAKSFLCKESSNLSFTDPNDAIDFMVLNHGQSDHERMTILYLNSKHKKLGHEVVAQGTINRAEIYPRVIAQQALKLNASAIIMCHNHPSGDTAPSQSDIALTARVREVMDLVDVRVLDHIIVGDGNGISLANEGRI